MAKHSVPKKKRTKRTTKQQYGSFQTKVLKQLSGLKLTKCPACGSQIPSHTVCPDCGKYRGNQIVNKQKEIDKITTIKA